MYLPHAGDYTYIHTVNTTIAKRIVKAIRNSTAHMWRVVRTASLRPLTQA